MSTSTLPVSFSFPGTYIWNTWSKKHTCTAGTESVVGHVLISEHMELDTELVSGTSTGFPVEKRNIFRAKIRALVP